MNRKLLTSLVLGLSLAAPRAWAVEPVFTPAEAESEQHRDELLKSEGARFCRAPRRPLGDDARALCPLAAQAKDCAGLVALCAEAEAPPKEQPSWLSTLAKAAGHVIQVLVWVFLAGLLLLLLVPAVRALRGVAQRGARARGPAAASVEISTGVEAEASQGAPHPAMHLLQNADDLRAAGRLREALPLYLAASLRGLADRGLLVLGRHRTNGEYVRTCSDERARTDLRELVISVERAEFGGRVPASEDVDQARTLAQRLLAVTMMLLLALGAPGCDARKPEGFAATDPAGHEVLSSLLVRSGVQVTLLNGSLSSLPIPKPGDDVDEERTSRYLLVDTKRTRVSEEAWGHLERWVYAGGNLIVAGVTDGLPAGFRVERAMAAGHTVQVPAPELPPQDDPDEDEEASKAPAPAPGASPLPMQIAKGKILAGAVLRQSVTLATLDGAPFAARAQHGKGSLVLIASSDPLSNVGLSVPGNAAAAARLFRSFAPAEIMLAGPLDGLSLPDSPLAALAHAGLLRGLWHALVFALILFAYAGLRHARPKPPRGVARRAFAEHVRATGALYEKAKAGPHAVLQYGHFVIEELHARRADKAQVAEAKRLLGDVPTSPDQVEARLMALSSLLSRGEGRGAARALSATPTDPSA